MRTNEEMRKKIMSQVYRMYFFRQFGTPVIRVGIFTGTILIALSFVSVPQVLENVAHVSSMTGFIAFFVSAFLKTELFVQFALSIAGLVAVWSAVDIAKRFSLARPARAA